MLTDRWYRESIKNLYKNATRVPKMYPGALLTRNNPIECNLLLFKQKKKGRIKYGKHGAPVRSSNSKKNAARAREPWLLASSLTSSSRTVKLYKTRMQIEESFRDLKSSRYGLGLEQSDTYKLERLANLVLIGSLAAIVCWIIGKAAHISRLHYQFQANSIKHKPVISLVYLGLQIIQRPHFVLDKNICDFAVLALPDTVQGYARA
jgi:hypothetical protein